MLSKENRHFFMAITAGNVVSGCGFDMSAYQNIVNYCKDFDKKQEFCTKEFEAKNPFFLLKQADKYDFTKL